MDAREKRINQIKRRTQLLNDPEYVRRARLAQKRQLFQVGGVLLIACAMAGCIAIFSNAL